MMDLISCYSQYSVQISESSSCSTYTPTSSCLISPNNNSIPSTQTAVSCIYKITLTTGDHHYITVTWYRNATVQGLQITTGDDTTPSFRLNTSSNSRLFRKKKGAKSFETNETKTKFEVYYDLSSAQYEARAEPVEGYYVLVVIDSELGLLIGDMTAEPTMKRIKQIGKFYLVCRKEHFSGNTVYSTKAKFSDTGNSHDIMIRCSGENDGLKKYPHPVLLVLIDKRVVIRVKRLQWNFRGNQTIFLDGLLVDLMWDVHDWFFNPALVSGSGSGSGSGHAVFMFRTRSGLDSRLWLEEKIMKSDNDDDQKKGFSLLVYATKRMVDEASFRPREKLIEKQRLYQSIHKHTYLKGPMDKITSVAIPLALTGYFLKFDIITPY